MEIEISTLVTPENSPRARVRLVTRLFSELDCERVTYAVRGAPGEIRRWCQAETRKDLDVWVSTADWERLVLVLKAMGAVPVYTWTQPEERIPRSAIFVFLGPCGASVGSIDFSVGGLRAGQIEIATEQTIAESLLKTEEGAYFQGLSFILDFFLRRLLRGKTFSEAQVQLIRTEWSRLSLGGRRAFSECIEVVLSERACKKLESFLDGGTDYPLSSVFRSLVRFDALVKLFLSSPFLAMKAVLDHIVGKRAPRDRRFNPAGARPRSVSVAIVGTDGSGKSTLVQALAGHLERFGLPVRAVYLGRVRGGLVGNSFVHGVAGRLVRRKRPPINGKEQCTKSRLPPWSRRLASWLYVFDYLSRHLLVGIQRSISMRSVIFDRYSYDLHIMPDGSPLAAGIVTRFAPDPDIVCFLDLPEQVILERTLENEPEEVRRQQRILAGLLRTKISSVRLIHVQKAVDIGVLCSSLCPLIVAQSMVSHVDNRGMFDEFFDSLRNSSLERIANGG